jgi:hypothetical protein
LCAGCHGRELTAKLPQARVVGATWAERTARDPAHRGYASWPDGPKTIAIARRRVAQLATDPRLTAELARSCITGAAACWEVTGRRRQPSGPLQMLVEVLPGLAGRVEGLDRLALYQTYIHREFRRDQLRHRRLRAMTDGERIALLKRLVADRFERGKLDLDMSDAARLVAELLGLPAAEAEAVARDFLGRSLLMRDGDVYRFAHKSIGEYLVALEIHRRLMAGEPNPWDLLRPRSGDRLEPALVERIFEFGFTSHGDGLGVGLAVARLLVELHGGAMTAESHPDRARFRIHLQAPAAERKAGHLYDSRDIEKVAIESKHATDATSTGTRRANN